MDSVAAFHLCLFLDVRVQAGAVKDYIKMMLEAEQLKFLVFAHHHTMLQACTEAVIEAKVTSGALPAPRAFQRLRRAALMGNKVFEDGIEACPGRQRCGGAGVRSDLFTSG